MAGPRSAMKESFDGIRGSVGDMTSVAVGATYLRHDPKHKRGKNYSWASFGEDGGGHESSNPQRQMEQKM